MRRTIIATTALAAAALTGCSATSATVNTTPAATSAATSQAAAKASAATTSAAPKKAGIGDTISLQGHVAGNVLDVTLVKLVDPAPPTSSDFAAPAGKHVVGVQLQIVNHGHDVYQADPQMATKVTDSAGETFTASITDQTSAGQEIDSGLNLAPGDKSLGFVLFEVPDGAKISEVQYLANTVGGNVAQWTVG